MNPKLIPILFGLKRMVVALSITGSKGQEAGSGNFGTNRTSTATVQDFESIVKNCKVGETRYLLGRRTWNRFTGDINSPNGYYGAGSITIAQDDPNGGTSAIAVNMPTSATGCYWNITNILYSVDAASLWIRADTPGEIKIFDGNGGGYSINLTVTTAWQRMCAVAVKTTSSPVQFAVYRAILAQLSKVYIWQPQLEDVTGQSNQSPAEWISGSTTYNAGAVGVKYSDTYNGNTVSSNVVTDAQGAPLPTKPTILVEPASTNYALNSNTPATQTIVLSAGTYTISITGSGSFALTGGATGTVTSAAPLTFTTSGSTTFTKTGTVNTMQIEAGSYATSLIVTTSSAVTRTKDTFTSAIGNIDVTKGVLLLRFSETTFATAILAKFASLTGGSNLLYKNISDNNLKSADSTNTASLPVTFSTLSDCIFALAWSSQTGQMLIAASINGGATWTSTTGSFDGSFTTGSAIEILNTIEAPCNLKAFKVYPNLPGNMTATYNWIVAKAAQETAG